MAGKIYAKARFAYNNKPLEWWETNDPVLENGEPGIVSDATNDEWLKIGDGVTSWNDLGWKKGPQGVQGKKGEPGKDAVTDRKYNPESENAQSGLAVAEAISTSSISTTTNQEGALLSGTLPLTLVSSTGWTANGDGSYTHTSGTDALEFSVGEDTGTNLYQIIFEGTNITNKHNSIVVSVGNSSTFDLYGGVLDLGIRSVENGNLKFVPASDYTGTISNIVVKKIIGTAEQNERMMVKDSTDTVSLEVNTSSTDKDNIFVGKNSGRYNISGWGNYTLGHRALENNISGFRNIGMGSYALQDNTVGSRNIGIGYIALQKNISGLRNTAIGGFALSNNLTGNRNVAIGEDAMNYVYYGNNNIGIGVAALYRCYQGSNNIGIGNEALYGVTTGNNNIGIGTGGVTTGEYNILMGGGAGSYLQEGKWNVIVGNNACRFNKGGLNNVILGGYAGYGAKDSGTYSNNVFVGYNAGKNAEGGANDNILIGYNVLLDNPTDSNILNIGNLIKGSMANGNKYVQILGKLLFETPDGSNTAQAVNVEYLNNVVGDIETALDSIIAIQNELMGGES